MSTGGTRVGVMLNSLPISSVKLKAVDQGYKSAAVIEVSLSVVNPRCKQNRDCSFTSVMRPGAVVGSKASAGGLGSSS